MFVQRFEELQVSMEFIFIQRIGKQHFSFITSTQFYFAGKHLLCPIRFITGIDQVWPSHDP